MTDDPTRTRQEWLKAILPRDAISETTRRVAQRALESRQEGRLSNSD